MDEIIKGKIKDKYPEVFADNRFEPIFDIIFERLNCKEIDASEVTKGMTYIDSGEAAHLTGNIVLEVFNLVLFDKKIKS